MSPRSTIFWLLLMANLFSSPAKAAHSMSVDDLIAVALTTSTTGASSPNPNGETYIGGTTPNWSFGSTGTQIGEAGSVAGDWNGDGVTEVAVSSYFIGIFWIPSTSLARLPGLAPNMSHGNS